jgi:hypothetical protein
VNVRAARLERRAAFLDSAAVEGGAKWGSAEA